MTRTNKTAGKDTGPQIIEVDSPFALTRQGRGSEPPYGKIEPLVEAGATFAYHPGRELRYASLVSLASRYGIALPERTLKAQLGEAVRGLSGPYDVRAKSRGRGYGQTWAVSPRTGSQEVGDAASVVGVTVELTPDDVLIVSGAEDVRATVLGELERIRRDDLVKGGAAVDVITAVFRSLDGVLTVWGWFVPRESFKAANEFRADMEQVWGKWSMPKTEFQSPALRAGIRDGLQFEIDEFSRKVARDTSGADVPSQRLARTRLIEASVLGAKVERYGDIIGPGHVLGLRASLSTPRVLIEQYAGNEGA